jgi:protein O-mannosyl-transferase
MPQWFSFRLLGLSLVIAALTWLVFGSLTHSKFINFDDPEYVYENRVVSAGVTAENIHWAFTHTHASNWHPLTTLTHMLDCQWYGLSPGDHHRTNILLHMATAIALFLVLRQLTGVVWPGFFVALVFAIHPLRVESVAWVSERKDVLSGLFFMLTLSAYVYYARREWSWARYLWVVLLFACGLMSKPMLVTLPLVLFLLDYWPLNRFSLANGPGFSLPRRLILEKLPLLAMSVAVGWVVCSVQSQARESGAAIPFSLRLGNAAVSATTYLGQLFYPVNLAAYYPYPTAGQPVGSVIFAFLMLAGLTCVAVFWRRKSPWLLVGWGWYLIILLPVIGLIQVGAQAHADRYTYLPEIGLCLLLVWALKEGSPAWPQREWVLGGFATMLVATLMLQARAQVACWRDSETLWRYTLSCTTNNALAEANLATDLFRQNRMEESIEHARVAVQLEPAYAEAHNCLGFALYQCGQVNEAVEHLQLAVKLKPDLAAAHNNYGLVLMQTRQWEQAVDHLQIAVKLCPDNPDTQNNYGAVLMQTGRSEEAIPHYQRALQLSPDYVGALNNYAWLLATVANPALRNGSQAEQLAQRAEQLSKGSNLVVLRTLAAAEAETGQFAAAMETLRKAQQLAAQPGSSQWGPVLQAELELYQKGQPFRANGQTP